MALWRPLGGTEDPPFSPPVAQRKPWNWGEKVLFVGWIVVWLIHIITATWILLQHSGDDYRRMCAMDEIIPKERWDFMYCDTPRWAAGHFISGFITWHATGRPLPALLGAFIGDFGEWVYFAWKNVINPNFDPGENTLGSYLGDITFQHSAGIFYGALLSWALGVQPIWLTISSTTGNDANWFATNVKKWMVLKVVVYIIVLAITIYPLTDWWGWAPTETYRKAILVGGHAILNFLMLAVWRPGSSKPFYADWDLVWGPNTTRKQQWGYVLAYVASEAFIIMQAGTYVLRGISHWIQTWVVQFIMAAVVLVVAWQRHVRRKRNTVVAGDRDAAFLLENSSSAAPVTRSWRSAWFVGGD